MDIQELPRTEPTRAYPKPVVVVADDDSETLLALERLLREEPYDLYLTTDPEKALEWIRTRQVSVVISDQRMPGMDGATLLEWTRASSPRTARILLTAYPLDRIVLHARSRGLLTLLGKPWDAKELKRVVRERVRERELTDQR
ncbi:MAG TPA: response regulator [Planctomycetota bacterium]|nr:response regulator [Planctomycetota bacterium]